jgi:hypothetical protein
MGGLCSTCCFAKRARPRVERFAGEPAAHAGALVDASVATAQPSPAPAPASSPTSARGARAKGAPSPPAATADGGSSPSARSRSASGASVARTSPASSSAPPPRADDARASAETSAAADARPAAPVAPAAAEADCGGGDGGSCALGAWFAPVDAPTALPPAAELLAASAGASAAGGASSDDLEEAKWWAALDAERRAEEERWAARLAPLAFRVLRQARTEPLGSGAYLGHWAAGVYVCAGCGGRLYSSEHKLRSGDAHGWPAFGSALDGVARRRQGKGSKVRRARRADSAPVRGGEALTLGGAMRRAARALRWRWSAPAAEATSATSLRASATPRASGTASTRRASGLSRRRARSNHCHEVNGK